MHEKINKLKPTTCYKIKKKQYFDLSVKSKKKKNISKHLLT